MELETKDSPEDAKAAGKVTLEQQIEWLKKLPIGDVCDGLHYEFKYAILATLNSHAALIAQRDELVRLVRRCASKCGECGGKGYVYEGECITGRGPDDVFPEQVTCPDCADLRFALKSCAGTEGGI